MSDEGFVFDVRCPRCGESLFIGPVTLSVTNKVPKSLESEGVSDETVFIAAKHSNCYKCATCGAVLTVDDLTRSFGKKIAEIKESEQGEKSE